MNRMILIAALILISLQLQLSAQIIEGGFNDQEVTKTRTEQTFNSANHFINIRDFVHLSSGRMIVEVNNVNDFDRLKNLDSILTIFRKEISFYKDSLDGYPGNVRIDYLMQDNYDFREIRFKKYKPDGDIFVNKDGNISRLKIEQDTIRILIHAEQQEFEYSDAYKSLNLPYNRTPYTIQVTFYLDNVSDIDKIIADRKMLLHIIDTLQTTKSRRTVKSAVVNPSTTIYNPYSDGQYRFNRYSGILPNENYLPWSLFNRRDKLILDINMGLGLVRNTITPMGSVGVTWYNRRGFNDVDYNAYATLSATPYFFFDRGGDGRFFVKDNWFLNLEMGGAADILGMHTKLLTGGVGYLVVSKGDYFKGTTMKAFLNIKLKGAFTISPELIMTNNFKQIFPGITLKVF